MGSRKYETPRLSQSPVTILASNRNLTMGVFPYLSFLCLRSLVDALPGNNPSVPAPGETDIELRDQNPYRHVPYLLLQMNSMPSWDTV